MTALRPRARALLPTAVWVFHVALPLLGLWLLLAAPRFDVVWEHHQAHFWLVLATAVISIALGARVAFEARRRDDTRLYVVGLAFVTAAGFLALHALATPDVLLDPGNAGFALAVPIGLVIAGALAVLSSFDLAGPTLGRRRALIRSVLALFLLVWAAGSLLQVPPLDATVLEEEARGPLLVVALAGSLLYFVASVRYYRVFRRRPSAVLLSVITAFFLLGEALFAAALGHNWHASWWEWHVLMTAAFAFVAYSALLQLLREGSGDNLFRSIALEQTVRAIRAEHAAALEALVDAMTTEASDAPVGRIAHELGREFGLTEGQTDVLEEAADALANERRQLQRLGAMVAMGESGSVTETESALLERTLVLATSGFRPDRVRVAIVREGRVAYSTDGAEVHAATRAAVDRGEPVDAPEHGTERVYAVPLVIKGHVAGALELARPGAALADRDRVLLRSLANQLGIAIENARLYRQLEGLFRSYMSPDVATALLADPGRAELGGRLVVATVLFADLTGFTSFAERTAPEDVVDLLNECFGAAVPVVLREGGTIDKFMGDALMALFNAPAPQVDHALRAGRAALGLQRAVEAALGGRERVPHFRVGVHTGPAVVGNVGTEDVRNFTAIGDAVNLASRLQEHAAGGEVVVSGPVREQLGDRATVRTLGPVAIKGKDRPVEAFVLEDLT
ncbi:MAG: adenylate/guanylate cyclase domain-containing protein [Acidimicrobiia bacterium]